MNFHDGLHLSHAFRFAVSLRFCFSFIATSCIAYSSQRQDMSHAWCFALSLSGKGERAQPHAQAWAAEGTSRCSLLARSTWWAGVISTVGGCDFHRGTGVIFTAGLG